MNELGIIDKRYCFIASYTLPAVNPIETFNVWAEI